MRTFTDTGQRTWNLKIGLASARQVREATGGRVDFLAGAKTGGHDVFRVLSQDLELLGQVLWILCESQAEEAGVSELQFVEAFDMTTLEGATTALMEAVIDFFPSRSQALLREGIAMAQQIAASEAEAAETKARAMMTSPEMADLMRAAIRGKPSSSMPAFSA
jgi:hypothetical protein